MTKLLIVTRNDFSHYYPPSCERRGIIDGVFEILQEQGLSEGLTVSQLSTLIATVSSLSAYRVSCHCILGRSGTMWGIY